MAQIANEVLRTTYNYLLTVENILKKEGVKISSDKSYLDKIVPESITTIHSQNQQKTKKFFDNLIHLINQNAILTLVYTFENLVFSKYDNSYGEIKKIVKNGTPVSIAYYKSREKFLKGQLDGLSGIINLIEGQININDLEELKKIKEQRNFIAHGKRFATPSFDLNLSQVVLVLDNVLTQIDGKTLQ